jgi:hypothetical protein
MPQESQSACKEISMIVAHNNRIDGLDLLPHNALHLKFADDVFSDCDYKNARVQAKATMTVIHVSIC